MALAEAVRGRKTLLGSPTPRLAPPIPARTGADAFAKQASAIGIDLFPWQRTAGRYLTALGRADKWLYREVAIIVARQNGKTSLLVPHITSRIRAGRRVMHTAQNRELPREVFAQVAEIMETNYPGELAKSPRFANGQEEIILRNGGKYRIVAPTRGGARGPSNDDVIVDELREMVSHDFIAAAKPTLTASANPQMVYLSNEGTEESEVLNAIRRRAGEDPALAFLSWSAAPDRRADEIAGWLEANPAAGHLPGMLDSLEAEYRAHRLAGTIGIFETEHLCRKTQTIRERLVDDFDVADCHVEDLGSPSSAYMAVSMDPKGTRASAVLAWRLPDASIAYRVLYDVTGSPIDTDELGKDMAKTAAAQGARSVGGDPMTDAELGKYFRKFEPIAGSKFANASARFALGVESRRLRWDEAEQVADDLTWTTRKAHEESGSYQAVRADDERPITAALAAIRAVWLASNPVRGQARIW